MNEELLRLQSVSIYMEGEPVVDDISLTLHAGEILAIAGESGSGKSTLLRAILGLLPKERATVTGNIFFRGQNLKDCSPRELRRIRGEQIGMIFQHTEEALCPVRTIGSQLYETIAAHRRCNRAKAKQEALKLLELLRFPDAARIWNSYPFELSGGMNQRVGIALSMLLHPPILLADEPTSALDVTAARQVLRQLLQIRDKQQTAVLLVTHDLGVVRAAADTLLVMKDGRAVEYGPAADVLESPQSDDTKALLQAAPILRRRP